VADRTCELAHGAHDRDDVDASATNENIEAARQRRQPDLAPARERVVRENSFTRAALSLGIGQPAVSARIHALEAAIGGPL
jgi:hypothetical protein